jgi:hypothetical protein
MKATETNINDIITLWEEFMEFNGQLDPYDTMGTRGPREMRKRLQDL